MWRPFRQRKSASPARRRVAVTPAWSQVEGLEQRAMLSASCGDSAAVDAEVQIIEAASAKAAVPKIIDVNGTYEIRSSSGNTGTFTFVQNGLDVVLTVNTTHYPSGTVNLHFKTDHSKKARGTGSFQFAGEPEPQPVAMKIKFKVIDGELHFSYKYHTLSVS